VDERDRELPNSNDPGHVGPKMDPGWFDLARQIVLFMLGIWLIVWAATTEGHDVPFLVTGLILFGMVPLERVLAQRRRDND
jgi:hypothetical protein